MKYHINLLPSKQLTTLDRIIYFSFNYLRYILVITQLVVICVFLYRFNIDQEIVDTKDTLQQKLEIIKVSQPLLAAGEKLYQRSADISLILASQSVESKMMNYVLSRFPVQFFLTDMEIGKNDMMIKGFTPDANSMKSFYVRLKNEKKFQTVNLDSITKTEDGYEFIFNLNQYL